MGSTIRRASLTASAMVLALGLAACGGDSGTDEPTAEGFPEANQNEVSVLFGSSGAAETASLQAAVKAWSTESGIPTRVIPATDLVQEASQGFAGGNPADVLYVSTDSFAGWAGNGSLAAYGDLLPNADDFRPGLVQAFTLDGKFFCAPKDFSTLALVINTKMWADAGLTDADVPTTWDELEAVSKKLTKGSRVGLAMGPEIQRVGVFLAQNGGALVSEDGTTATANSPQNVEALTYLKQMMVDGIADYSNQLGAGWGGEAFGKGLTAMVIEGNWITGAMTNDFPDVDYKVVKLPAGTQEGTLQFTNCWGISADGDNTGGALSLVEYLTTTEQQLQFAKDFGVMPSLTSGAEGYKAEFPDMAAFMDSAEGAQNLPAMPGATEALRDLNSQLEKLETADPKAILDSAQANFEAILG